MSRWVAAWNRFWFAASDPHPIAAFRIMLGAYLVIYLGAFAPHAVAVFSDVGVYVPYGLVGAAPSSLVAVGLFSATLVLAMLLTVGYRTRLVAPLLLLGFLYHYFLSFAVKDSSYDRLIIVYLVVLCCVDAGRAWSLDAKSGRATGDTVPVWAEHILRFQTVALYFGAGLWKFVHPAWRSGTLLEETMQGMWSTPVGFWLAQQGFTRPFWMMASWSVIGLELAAGFLLFHQRTRALAVVLLALFHIANTAVLFIPEFLVCLVPLVLFVRPAEIRRSVRWLRVALRIREGRLVGRRRISVYGMLRVAGHANRDQTAKGW